MAAMATRLTTAGEAVIERGCDPRVIGAQSPGLAEDHLGSNNSVRLTV